MAGGELDPETIISRGEDAISEELGHETVILNPQSGRYVRLNRTGTVVWQALDAPRTVNFLIELLVQRFDVTDDRARNDLASFVDTLAERDMLSVSAEPA